MSGGLPQAFLDAIVADIDDDSPRLMYADWLDEQGDADRAEFIRVQVERARLPAWDASQLRLRLRERELLKRHGEAWLAELPAIEGARWEGFRRGIIAEVSFANFEAMRVNAHACRAVAPVEAVSVRWPRRREMHVPVAPIAELRELSLKGRPRSEDEIGWLADSPQLSTLRTLTTRGLWVEGLRRLLASPHLSGLRAFRLPSNNLGNEGILALTQAASLNSLRELTLIGQLYERYHEDPTVEEIGVQALAGWAGLVGVRSLTLKGSNAHREGLRALLRSPHTDALKELCLRGGGLNGEAVAEFTSARPGFRLEMLDLGENLLKDLGAECIATAPCLRDVKTLRLDRCEIPLAGSCLFARKATFFDSLRQLDIGHNDFGPIGLTALLERGLAALHTLRMRDNDLYNEGAALLAGSPASNGLLEVDLSQNHLGPTAAQTIGASAYLRNLLILSLADNPINESAAADLAASPLGQRLAVLELDKLPRDSDSPPVGEDEITF